MWRSSGGSIQPSLSLCGRSATLLLARFAITDKPHHHVVCIVSSQTNYIVLAVWSQHDILDLVNEQALPYQLRVQVCFFIEL